MEDIVTLRRFSRSVEAEICKALLADNGIDSVVIDDIMNTMYPPLMTPVRLIVGAENKERAEQILNAEFVEE